jgi:transcriptional regulator with PAS, ATPase and Fis domain
MEFDYLKEFDGAATVCDRDGVVIYCNDRSKLQFAKYGDLIGQNLKDCHLPASWDKICQLIETGENNIYTVEKNGIKKMICQTPWRRNGAVQGLIEISFVIPNELPHFVRN